MTQPYDPNSIADMKRALHDFRMFLPDPRNVFDILDAAAKVAVIEKRIAELQQDAAKESQCPH
jgi:hypothetical protein